MTLKKLKTQSLIDALMEMNVGEKTGIRVISQWLYYQLIL